MIRGPSGEYEEKVLWWIHVILELDREVLTSHVVGVADYILVAYICTNNVVIFSCSYISLLIHRGKPRGLARSSEEKVIDNGKNGDNLG